jgi:hypothetical protein
VNLLVIDTTTALEAAFSQALVRRLAMAILFNFCNPFLLQMRCAFVIICCAKENRAPAVDTTVHHTVACVLTPPYTTPWRVC